MACNYYAACIENVSSKASYQKDVMNVSIEGNECRKFAKRCGMFIVELFPVKNSDICMDLLRNSASYSATLLLITWFDSMCSVACRSISSQFCEHCYARKRTFGSVCWLGLAWTANVDKGNRLKQDVGLKTRPKRILSRSSPSLGRSNCRSRPSIVSSLNEQTVHIFISINHRRSGYGHYLDGYTITRYHLH